MINTDSPHYELTAPLVIGTHLTPAIAVGDGFVSVEANGIESGGRAHFRVHIDVPGTVSWTSEDSMITVMARDWTHAAIMALETICDALGSDDGPGLGGLPVELLTWLSEGGYMDASCVAEDLREILERDGRPGATQTRPTTSMHGCGCDLSQADHECRSGDGFDPAAEV